MGRSLRHLAPFFFVALVSACGGHSVADGGADGAGGARGDSDNLSAAGTCPSAPTPILREVRVAGYGKWPDFLYGSEAMGAGGAGPYAASDGIGCDWDDSRSLNCAGTATIGRAADPWNFEATFEDGSVVTFFIPNLPIPASGKVALSFAVSIVGATGFYGGRTSVSTMAHDESGRLLWLSDDSIDDSMIAEHAKTYLGAPVSTEAGCIEVYEDCIGKGTRRVFDHVVKTAPEQRIGSGKPTLVTTDTGSYDVTWFEVGITLDEMAYCPDAGPLETPGAFRMVLRATQ